MTRFVKKKLFAAAILSLNFEIASQTLDPRLSFEIKQQSERLRAASVEARRDAAHQLRILENAAASRAALPALADKAEIVRATAAEAVAYLADEDAAAALVPLLVKDKSELVRREAAFALGEAASKTAVPQLINALQTDKKPSVRAAVAITLGKIEDPRAVNALTQTLNAPDTKKNRRRIDEFVRRSAARALGQINQIAAIPSLIEALRNKLMPSDVRREAARSLGVVGDESAVSALTENLQTDDRLPAEIIAQSLSKIESKKLARLPVTTQE